MTAIKVILFSAALLCSLPGYALTITVQTVTGQPAQGVVAYLLPDDVQTRQKVNALPAAPPLTTISQKDKKFAPYLAVTQSHKDVIFANQDNITHHIYSLNGHSKFDFKIAKDAQGKTLRFEQADEIAMGCNIHDWMAGHLLVVDTPLYGIASKNGQVVFDSLPNGQYRLVVFHPQMGDVDKSFSQQLSYPALDVTVTLQQALQSLPTQENMDDFDFLEAYD